MNIFRIMSHRYIPPPIRPSPRAQAPKKNPGQIGLKFVRKVGETG